MSKTDKQIELVFNDLDRDGDGNIDHEEIRQGFANMGEIRFLPAVNFN